MIGENGVPETPEWSLPVRDRREFNPAEPARELNIPPNVTLGEN